MALSDSAVRNAKPTVKARKLTYRYPPTRVPQAGQTQRRGPTRFTPPFQLPGLGAATALAAGLTTGATTTGRATQPFGTPTVLQ
jgi:hypothetical protein